jgi:hypothetical protein
MKRFGIGLVYILIVIYSVIFFVPKINLYYELEHYLKQQQVVIVNEDIQDRGFSLNISDGTLFYGDLNVVTFSDISFKTLLVYNSIHMQPFELSDDMESFFPKNVTSLNAQHSIFNPLHVTFKGSGDFGSFKGDIDLLENKLHLILIPSKLLLKKKPFWMKKLKKDKEGGYRYAISY